VPVMPGMIQALAPLRLELVWMYSGRRSDQPSFLTLPVLRAYQRLVTSLVIAIPRSDWSSFGLLWSMLWSTNSGHWFRFIRPVIQFPLASCIRCSCVVVDGCSNPSGSAAHQPQLVLGWYSHAPASTPFSGF
jgi:hypothetical protein